MFARKPVEIDSRNRIFISSRPKDEGDMKEIVKLGIKKVVMFGLLTSEEHYEEHWLQEKGIKVEIVNINLVEDERPLRSIILRALSKLEKGTLMHCYGGQTAQIAAMCYFVRKGLTPEQAIARVESRLKAEKVDVIHITPDEARLISDFQKPGAWKKPITRAQIRFRLAQKKWRPRKTKRWV
jgi:hypothetical protein